MECLANVHSSRIASPAVLPAIGAGKRIGIALFNGFDLPSAATIVEVFQTANDFTSSPEGENTRYEISLVSATGGRISSSSSVFVWTESIEAHRATHAWQVLFIAGGSGVAHALRDERLMEWLRRVYPRSETVLPLGEGRLLLDSAGFRPSVARLCSGGRAIEFSREPVSARPTGVPIDPLRTALAIVQGDHGTTVAQQIGNWIAPASETEFTATVRKNAATGVSEPIQASARWLEANGDRPISIDDAAQVATMSSRNFLRRFKLEMGVTPSDYLLHVRLDMSCRLLTETGLPIDKIARRCGIGSGERLSKLFRKHLGTTPTEYRAARRVTEA